jgi:hypothetical protein
MMKPVSRLMEGGSRFAKFRRYLSNSLAEGVLRKEFW